MNQPSLFRASPLFVCVLLAVQFLLAPTTGYTTDPAPETLVPLHIYKGANLIKLAKKYCKKKSDWKKIARVNQLSSPFLIIENQTLQVPFNLLKATHFSAKIAAVHGEVYKQQGVTIIGKAAKNDTLLPGQTIVTGAGSYAHLIFADHKYTRVAPYSELTINYMIRLADNKLKVELLLDKGRIIHTIKRKLKQNETFKTRTPVSVTGVRGTEFRLKMSDHETNIAETLSGEIGLQAAGEVIGLKEGQGAKVKKNNPPSLPLPLPPPPAAPQLQSVYKVLPAALIAPAHPMASFIRLRLTSDRQGERTLLEQQKKPGEQFMLVPLADSTYFCFLTAIDAAGFESLPSGPFPILVRTIPGAPLLSAPKNNSQTFTTSIPIRWLQSEHAHRYRIELASDPSFKNPINRADVEKTEYKTPVLLPGKYFFRVQAVAQDGFVSNFSADLSFEIAKPSKLAPITGSSDKDLTLQWSAAQAGLRFDLQIGLGGDFKNPVIHKNGLKKPSYTITSYLKPGQYHVRVRTILEDGQKSPWSPPQMFTVPQEPFSIGHGLTLLTLIALILL